MNVTPYGVAWDHQVGRLEETLQILRPLSSSDHPVDCPGRYYTPRDAVLGLEPCDGRVPALRLDAHGS